MVVEEPLEQAADADAAAAADADVDAGGEEQMMPEPTLTVEEQTPP